MENEQYLRTIVILRERSAKKSQGQRGETGGEADTRTQAVISHRLGDRGRPNGTLNTRHCTLDWNRWERFSASWICCIVQTEEPGEQTDRQIYTHTHIQNKNRHIDWKHTGYHNHVSESFDGDDRGDPLLRFTYYTHWMAGEGGKLTRGRGMAYKNTDFQ